jgi:hypothetical protein
MKSLALVLLLTLAACRGPIEKPAPEPELPPIPAFVPSPLGPVAVIWMDSIPSEQPGFLILGRYRPMERQVWIWKGVKSRAEQWRVFLHEVCHLRSWDARIRWTDENIEAMCDVMAYEVASLLRAYR